MKILYRIKCLIVNVIYINTEKTDIEYSTEKFYTSSVEYALLFGGIEVDSGDEVGVAFDIFCHNRDRFGFASSKWTGEDKLWKGCYVSFVPLRLEDLKIFLKQEIFYNAVATPRRKFIDPIPRFQKIVAVVFVKHRSEVLLIPRIGKSILSNVLTLSVMESITIEDLYWTYKERMDMELDPPWTHRVCGYKSLVNERDLKSCAVNFKRLPIRGIIEECPYIAAGDIFFNGVVGGGKDIGLVWGIEIEDSYIYRRIKEVTNAISFEPDRFSYDDVSSYFGGQVDGWSEAILNYVLNP